MPTVPTVPTVQCPQYSVHSTVPTVPTVRTVPQLNWGSGFPSCRTVGFALQALRTWHMAGRILQALVPRIPHVRGEGARDRGLSVLLGSICPSIADSSRHFGSELPDLPPFWQSR